MILPRLWEIRNDERRSSQRDTRTDQERAAFCVFSRMQGIGSRGQKEEMGCRREKKVSVNYAERERKSRDAIAPTDLSHRAIRLLPLLRKSLPCLVVVLFLLLAYSSLTLENDYCIQLIE